MEIDLDASDVTIAVRFSDASVLRLAHAGLSTDAFGDRNAYAYTLSDEHGAVIDQDTIRSAVGAEVDVCEALATWTSFYSEYAEGYASTMAGDVSEEWAYSHADEILELALRLDEDASPTD